MLSQEQNDLITRIGPGTAAGNLLRRYWQPVALVDEISGANRPIKPVRLMDEDLVLFRDEGGYTYCKRNDSRNDICLCRSSTRRCGLSW